MPFPFGPLLVSRTNTYKHTHNKHDYCSIDMYISIHSEWVTNQHRDTYASHIAHYDQLAYYAVAQNDSIGRVRSQLLGKMIQPCGP